MASDQGLQHTHIYTIQKTMHDVVNFDQRAIRAHHAWQVILHYLIVSRFHFSGQLSRIQINKRIANDLGNNFSKRTYC